MSYSNKQPNSPSVLIFVGWFTLGFLGLSVLLAIVGLSNKSLILPTLLAGSSLATHMFYKKHHRLITPTEQIRLSFFCLLSVVFCSILAVFLIVMIENSTKLMVSQAIKSQYFWVAILAIVVLNFIGILFSIKVYSFLLARDHAKNQIAPQKLEENELTEVPEHLLQQLNEDKNVFKNELTKSDKRWHKRFMIFFMIVAGIFIMREVGTLLFG